MPMLSFIQFISHSNKTTLHEATGQGIDATGKLFELHTMRHLAGGDHPRHYRDDNLGHPAAAAETLKGRVDQEEYDKVLKSSEAAADRIREHIAKNHPGFVIHKVTWASNKRDIQRFHEDNKTGGTQTEQDNADYIVSIKHPETGEIRHIGISSKYSADPTARSPGIDALSNMAKANSDETRNIVRDHDKKISSVMGFTNQSSEAKSDIFRRITAGGSKEELSKKREVDDISRSRGVTLAQHLHKAFSNIHPNNIAARNEHMKGVISTLSGAGGKN